MKLMENTYFYPYRDRNLSEQIALKVIWFKEQELLTGKLYVEVGEFFGMIAMINISVPKIDNLSFFYRLAAKVWRFVTKKEVQVVDAKDSFIVLRVFPFFKVVMFYHPKDRCFYIESNSWIDFNIRLMVEESCLDCVCSDVHFKSTDLVKEFHDGKYYIPVTIVRKGSMDSHKRLVYMDMKKLNIQKLQENDNTRGMEK